MTNSLEDASLHSAWKKIQSGFWNCDVGQNLITKFICGLCKILVLSRTIGIWPRIVGGNYSMMKLKGPCIGQCNCCASIYMVGLRKIPINRSLIPVPFRIQTGHLRNARHNRYCLVKFRPTR